MFISETEKKYLFFSRGHFTNAQTFAFTILIVLFEFSRNNKPCSLEMFNNPFSVFNFCNYF